MRDFSRQGKRLGWLGAESVATVMWATSQRFNRTADLVMLECVPDFDYLWLQTLSGGKLAFDVCVLVPYDGGLPVTGPRLWGASAQGKLRFALPHFDDSMLDECFRRDVVSRPDMWLTSTPEQQLAFAQHVGARDACSLIPEAKLFGQKTFYLQGTTAASLSIA